MKSTSILVCLALLVPASLLAANSGRQLGDTLTLSNVTSIATILASPSEFEGKRVQVQGKVTAVCKMKGCWLLVADTEGREIRVKVQDDGPIVFPQDAPGGTATVEGTVKRIPMTRDQYIAWHRHLAEENGQKYDASGVGAGPFERIELTGLAAKLE
ncbi:MAG: DUF4920 domain-containing protein [Thermoanaerobaculia bacterium]|nr:DUF4920 domain-containing protein [Thermoanaerobaculia bacterium]